MKLQEIMAAVDAFFRNHSLNTVGELNHLPIFDFPLFGIAKANDPLFKRLCAEDAVGSIHKQPQEWLAGAQSVVSYFLPFTSQIREANRKDGLPAKEWLYGRIEGELMNIALRQFLIKLFTDAGYMAVAPALDNRFQVHNLKSNWSERHVAFITGLGTFSLSRSMITRRGAAGRIGSVIVNADIEATLRYYTDIYENCSKCGCCIPRCPPQAISEQGKDNLICGQYLDEMKVLYQPRYGCGKCQTAVPCEAGIPEK